MPLENNLNFDKLKKIISLKLGVPEEQITTEAYLHDDFNADPLSLSDLMTNIEDEFEVKITEEAATKFATVQNILDFINDQAPI